jgi:hypothetical protein
MITAGFVSFGDINIRRKATRLLGFFVRKNLQNSFTADVHHLLSHSHVAFPEIFVTSRCIFLLLGTAFSGYVLLNTSRTSVNCFFAD